MQEEVRLVLPNASGLDEELSLEAKPNTKKRARGYRNVKGGACNFCKARHVRCVPLILGERLRVAYKYRFRCDGKLPCSLCVQKGEVCIYTPRTKKRKLSEDNNQTQSTIQSSPTSPGSPDNLLIALASQNTDSAQAALRVVWNIMRASTVVGVQQIRHMQYIGTLSCTLVRY